MSHTSPHALQQQVPTMTPPTYTEMPPDIHEVRARNRCHKCGATAYKTLIARDAAGAMRPSGRFQCVQCRLEFSLVSQWREGIVPMST